MIGLWLISRTRGQAARTTSLLIFTIVAVLLLVVSGIYHWLPHGTFEREVFRRLDHSAIWTMIAGTFTAIHLVGFRGTWRWSIPAVAWVIACVGIVFKLAFYESFSELVWLSAYLGLGWLGVLSIVELARKRRWGVVRLMLWGGLAYTFGAVLEYWRGALSFPRLVGPHEVFHVAVIVGIALHWLLVWRLGQARQAHASPLVLPAH